MHTALLEGAKRHVLYLPEVTFLRFRLECSGKTGHAVRMREFIKSLFYPLSLAGLLAWGAIGFELLWGRPETPDWLASPTPTAVLAALHALFLVLFIWPNKTRAAVLGQLLVALCLMLLARAGSLPILLIIVMAQVAQLWPSRTAGLLFIVVNVLVYFIYARIWLYQSPLVMTLMYMSFQGFAAITSWYAVSAERTRDQLAAINAELLGTRSLLDASVRDSERLRISRELHDVAGHKLTALKLNLKALQRRPEFSALPELQIAADLSDELLQDIRAVVQQLRLHDGPPLREALQALAAPFPQLTLQLQLDEACQALSITEAEVILRCVQEALTNAIKHANARQLQVRLHRNGQTWQLAINDDGHALPEVRLGNGLNGMRERIESLGGQLHLQTTHGMPLSAQWPVRE
jgi:signal transduction histidine kinase